MTIAEMLDRMSSAEFGFWVEYHTEHPWGEERADIRESTMAAAVCAALGATVKPEKLIPKFGRRRATSPAELRAKLESLSPERYYRDGL